MSMAKELIKIHISTYEQKVSKLFGIVLVTSEVREGTQRFIGSGKNN